MNLIAKMTIFFTWLVATPITPNTGLWAQWGLAGLVVSYTFWRDWQREKRMSDELNRNQEWVRITLVEALNDNTAAMRELKVRMKD